MTEKKRFTSEIHRISNNNEEIACADTMGDAEILVDLLNEQEETIQTQKDYIIRMGHGTIFEEMKRLKERNQRQYEQLKEITDLMMERDWESLEKMVEDWEQTEKKLEREWGTYCE